MTITQLLILIIIGLASGLLSGFLGVGGGVIVIPALVLILGFSQHEAQGTNLAFMLSPIGILAVMNYWKAGYVNWKYAIVLALAFFVGAYFGSYLSIEVSGKILRKVFGVIMLVVAVKVILSK